MPLSFFFAHFFFSLLISPRCDLDLSVLFFGTRGTSDAVRDLRRAVEQFCEVSGADERTALFYVDGAMARGAPVDTASVAAAQHYFGAGGMQPAPPSFDIGARLTVVDGGAAAPGAASPGAWDGAWELVTHCSYQQLAVAGCTHSGDVTSAPHPTGARETVRIDVAAVLAAYPGVRAIALACFSYSGIAYEGPFVPLVFSAIHLIVCSSLLSFFFLFLRISSFFPSLLSFFFSSSHLFFFSITLLFFFLAQILTTPPSSSRTPGAPAAAPAARTSSRRRI